MTQYPTVILSASNNTNNSINFNLNDVSSYSLTSQIKSLIEEGDKLRGDHWMLSRQYFITSSDPEGKASLDFIFKHIEYLKKNFRSLIDQQLQNHPVVINDIISDYVLGPKMR